MRVRSYLSASALLFALPLMLTANNARADVINTPFDLGGLEAGQNSRAYFVTDNLFIGGEAVVGGSFGNPYIWTSSTGMVDLGVWGGNYGVTLDATADHQFVVGYTSIDGTSARRAFRWTEENGKVDIGGLGGTIHQARTISSDGSVIFGHSWLAGNTSYHAFRWTQNTGMVDLGTLGGTNSRTYYSKTNDGTNLTGSSQITGNAAWHAFHWTQDTGMVDMGTLGGTNSYGDTSSHDGLVITGYSQTVGNSAYHAFRWTQETGMVDIGSLGGAQIYAPGVSDDGSIVVGWANPTASADWRAWRWTQETGMRDLNDLFIEAGVDMSGIELIAALSISPNGKYIAGTAYFNGSSVNSAFLSCYDPNNGCVGLTTASKQEEAAIDLASNQQIAMTESRAAANELMGFTRPMTMGTQTFSGAMFGSAMGYAGGQYTKDRFTLLGGLGYGAQDYKYIKPENALTVASGLRYTFDSVTGEQAGIGSVSPFVEAGGWYTPDMEVALSRPYNNGSGTNRGEGNTNSSSWAEYVKAGLVWDQSEVNQFTAYGEIGRQHMLFDGYSETVTSSNPFPATISDSEMTFNFARAGGSWTRQLDKFMGKPVSFTVAGAVAHSFGVKTNLTSTVSGVGTAHAIAKKNLWAEYGGRLSSDLTDNVALNLDVTGTTGNNGMGTAIHGGAGVSVKF